MGTKIAITAYDETISWETPQEDCSIDQVVEGFYMLLRGVTFSDETIIEGFKRFIKSND